MKANNFAVPDLPMGFSYSFLHNPVRMESMSGRFCWMRHSRVHPNGQEMAKTTSISV
jgi:hypothetical protein